jgi:hypothetical protein
MVFRTRADALEPEIAASEAVKDAVGHMVRQFVDPLAFYRELVQNSIDAGAQRIDVRLRYDTDVEALIASVHDDGAGMSLEIIERCLLVLFRSSKDKDPSKIGKFGVGFFSVFAVGPKSVRVDTGTGPDGYRLELDPDYTYEVTESSPRKGTSVTLVIPMRANEARSFAERSLAALRRWCPHVEVALHLLSTIRGGELDARIDGPFAIDGALTDLVREGGVTIATAPANEGRAAFYKRGILLYECPNVFCSGVSFKVEANTLVHTVSRDNVKRDGAFAKVLLAVESAVRERLLPRVGTHAREALAEALAASASDKADANARHALNDRAAQALRSLELIGGHGVVDLPLPLCEPDAAGARVYLGSAQKLRYFAAQPDLLTGALAIAKQPVLWTHALGDAYADFLQSKLPATAVDAHGRFCGLAPRDGALPPFEEDALARVRKLLAAVGIPEVRLVELAGVSADALFIAIPVDELAKATLGGVVIDASDVSAKLYALFANRACALNRGHPAWRTAVAAAEQEPAIAALTIARLVILAASKLDGRRDRSLFDAFPSVD